MKIKVSVPATSANIGSGFDALGLAVTLYNTVTFEESDHLDISAADGTRIPRGESNLVYRSAKGLFDKVGKTMPPLKIVQTNAIPMARGLGSSSACIIAGLLADARGIALGLGNDLIAVGNDLLAGLVMGAALDPQRRVCLLTLLGQFLVFPHKVAVFQAQHIQLVCQRVVALLRGGILRFQIGAVALQLVHLPGQRCILGRKVLVLHHKGLGMTAQGVIFLPDGAQLGGRRCKVLLIIGTKLPHCLTHIVRLIAAKACFTHSTLLHKTGHINFWHGILPPPAPGSSTAKAFCAVLQSCAWANVHY